MGYIMSDIFLKNKNDSKLSDFLDTEAASTSSLPQWLSIVDKQEGGNIDSASSNISEIENQLKQEFQKLAQEGGKRRKSKKVDVTEENKPKKAKKSSKKASKKSSKKGSKKGSKKMIQEGGKKKKSSKKGSKKASKKSSKKSSKKASKASKKGSKKASKKASK